MCFDLLFYVRHARGMRTDHESTQDGRSSRPTPQDKVAGTSRTAIRGIWLAIIVLAAMVVSTITSVALVSVGAPSAATIGATSALFIGATGLGVNILKFLTD
jgi:hypothetical protein